jgi:hypothetical protein
MVVAGVMSYIAEYRRTMILSHRNNLYQAMYTIRRTSVLLLGMAALAFTGFGQAQQVELAVPPRPAHPPTETSIKLKSYTFEQRVELSDFVAELGREADAAIAELTAGYVEMEASPAHRAAMEAVRLAAVEFKSSTSALGDATADTWVTVTSNLAASWVDLRTALDQARETKA